MAETEKPGESVRAVDRALEILLAFTATDYELTVGQLLKRVDLSRPTLYRLLYTLEQCGFVVSEGDPQKFRLGPSVGQLAHVWTSSLDLSSLATPPMQRLREQTGETVALFVLQGGDRLCIAELPSPQPLSFKRGIGYRERISVGASGRAILASIGQGDEDRRRYAAERGLDIARPAEDLDLVKRRGYAVSKDELIQGAVAIAAPFFDRSGQVAGSLGVFGPSARLPAGRIEEFGELVVREAAELSRTLGSRTAP
ncbi:MAG: transcriptional regulator [Bordetella sp. SCN 67-23]|nr:MAG: transcriptional regulator [Bordetella sp. SCN 67-23]OJW87839.1 MAG: transcriptional regulator [Burkholderiales bacterium 67-32]